VADPSASDALEFSRPTDATSRAIASLAGRPVRLSVVIVEALVDRIVSAGYPPGVLLPPEPVLCQFFDVSRSVIREALKALEQKGLVTVRQGHGTVVADAGEWNLLDPVVLAATVRHDDRREVVDDLIAVRAALEADMAARATTLLTDVGIDRLRSLVTDLEQSFGDRPRFLELDTEFHDELMRVSGNRLARAVVRSLHDQARSSAGYNDPHPEDLNLTHRGHLAILERIEARDRDGAAAAMRAHILSMWRRKRLRFRNPDDPVPA
jgi:DNA-binding FadR family transcriptional regulator